MGQKFEASAWDLSLGVLLLGLPITGISLACESQAERVLLASPAGSAHLANAS